MTRPIKPSKKIPAPIQTFGGPSNVDPPDTNGVVGPNHYIQIINSVFTIYDKSGNVLSGPTSLYALFAANPATGTPCDYEFDVDPVVLYDQIADRFIITNLTPTSFDVNNNTVGPYYECIAVSKTSNPVNGGWYKYVLTADATILNDYPKLGVWPDAYYMSANMGGCCGDGSFVRVWALDRNSILGGGGLTAQAFTVTSGYNSLLPENMLGFQQPSVGEPNVFAAVDYNNNNTLYLWNFHVDWGNPAASTFGVGGGHTPDHTVSVASYTHLSQAIPQPGPFPSGPPATTAVYLDPLGDRAMAQAQYRRIGSTESLWVNHTVDTGGNLAGIRWYEVHDPSGSPSLAQQGTFNNGNDGIHRWLGSLASDGFGNMAVGYSVSSSSLNPGIRYAGRLAADAAGTLGQGEATLFAGTGNQVNCTPDFAHGQTTCTTRWGDYSGMSVDPVDDCTFWYTNEYGTGSGYATRIGSFRLSGCDADVSVSKTGPATVTAGTNLTYNLTFTNIGPVAAENISLSDTVPTNTTFVSWTQNTGAAFVCTKPSVGATGTVNCSVASLANGASATFTFVVHVSPSAPNSSTLSNTATISTTSHDPTPGNNLSTANTTVLTSADLGVNKSATTDPVSAGTNETYNLTLTNNGPSDAQTVLLTDATPVNTTFVSSAQNTGPAFACINPPAGGTGTTTCTIATLAEGASATFSFVVHVSPSAPDGSTLSNTISGSSTTSDPNSGNNSKSITTGVIAHADVSIVKKGALSADRSQIIWKLTVVNNGPSNANAVSVKDALLVTTKFQKVTTTLGNCIGGAALTCALGTMGPGDSATITITVWIIKSAVTTDNTATVSTTTTDPNLANNSSSASIPLGSAFEWDVPSSRL